MPSLYHGQSSRTCWKCFRETRGKSRCTHCGWPNHPPKVESEEPHEFEDIEEAQKITDRTTDEWGRKIGVPFYGANGRDVFSFYGRFFLVLAVFCFCLWLNLYITVGITMLFVAWCI
jgi:hypothetical protein